MNLGSYSNLPLAAAQPSGKELRAKVVLGHDVDLPRFRGRFRAWALRDECLSIAVFVSLEHARQTLTACQADYNRVRPHSALGNLTPGESASEVRLTPIWHRNSRFGRSKNRCMLKGLISLSVQLSE